MLGELTSSIGRRGRVDREMADAYVRRLRKADRADAAEELQALAEVVDMAQGWVTWALAELETLDQTRPPGCTGCARGAAIPWCPRSTTLGARDRCLRSRRPAAPRRAHGLDPPPGSGYGPPGT